MSKITDSAHRITELISELGLTQTEFGRNVGLDKSTVSLYVTGKREPRQDKISDISDFYGIEPAWLMGYDVPMKKVKFNFSSETATKDIELLTAFHHLSADKQELALQLIKSMT